MARLEINSVCKTCNTDLSKKFNEPFLRSPFIGIYRKHLNLHRSDERTGERKIANPLKNATIQGENASEYFIVYENGKPKAKRKPKVTLTKVEGGWQGQVVVSKEDFEKVKADVFKKYGIDESKIISTTEVTVDPPLTFFSLVPQKPILFEGLKMAYEFAVTTIPEYFNDDWAKIISSFLHKNEHLDLVNARIESVNNMMKDFEKDFALLNEIPKHFHTISLKHIYGKGLICFVKIFERIIPYHISNNQYFSQEGKEIAVFNNSVERNHILKFELRWKEVSLQIDLTDLNKREEKEVKSEMVKNNESIREKEDQIPVFTKSGGLFAQNLADVIPYFFPQSKEINFAEKKVTYSVILPDRELFIRYNPSNKLLPLMGFTANYEIVR